MQIRRNNYDYNEALRMYQEIMDRDLHSAVVLQYDESNIAQTRRDRELFVVLLQSVETRPHRIAISLMWSC